MKALNNYILIEKYKSPEQKSSGLLLATTEKPRYVEGVVAESGSEFIEKGNKVLYDAVAGHDLRLNDKMYKVVKHSDIVIVLE